MNLDNLGKALNESSSAKGKKKTPRSGKDPLGGLVDSLNSGQGGSGNLSDLLGSSQETPSAAPQQQAPAWQDAMASQTPAQGGLGSLLGGLEGASGPSGSADMGGLGSLLGMLGGGSPTSSSSQPAQGGLGSLLGGLESAGGSESSSSGMGGMGSLLGMLGGGSPTPGSSSAGMGGLGSLLGMLGGGSGSQTSSDSMSFLGNSTAGSPFDALAAPLAKKLGIPTQLASLLIMFVANSLLGSKKTNRSGQLDVNRAADVSQVLDLAERGQINQNALSGNQLVHELSQETGLDEETSARGIHELMLMLNQGAVE